MNNSPVLALQSLASSSDADVQEVLLKAKMISVKLGLTDISQWLECEINGYANTQVTIPDYRVIKGVPIRAHNPFNGWIHVDVSNISNDNIYDFISTVRISDPISSLFMHTQKAGSIFLALPKPQVEILNKLMSDSMGFQLAWVFSSIEMIRIVSTVKAKILDWSLDLEKKCILGENLQFSQKEKEVAQMTVNNTNNFNGTIHNAGVIGSGNSDFSQENMIVEKNNFSSLENELKKYGISEEDLKDLKLALDEIPAGTISKDNLGAKIGGWVGRMVGKAYSGTLKITGAVASQVLTKAICTYIGIPD